MINSNHRFRVYCWLAILLCLPAFLYNLNLAPFIGDEAIRSLVALEMMLSENYITPSMTGDFYFSKPPLYNWILIVFFKFFGAVNEFVARIPTVLFSFLFAYIIYLFNRKRFSDKKLAILNAFMFLTCGRMLFYDSFLGLIDIFFSMITYIMIISALRLAEKNELDKMYFSIYGFFIIGFMLKGLTIFHFLLFTILIIHFLFGQWKKLISKAHIFAILISLIIIASYFYFYNQYRAAADTLSPLLDQATRRTVLRFEITDVLKHTVSYPFENLYHFFPWSIMGFLILRKDIIQLLKKDKYIYYLALSFVINFIVYWLSPEVYPRYILMLIPLAFTIWVYLYQFELGNNNVRMKLIAILFKALTIITPIVILLQINNPKLQYVEYAQTKLIILVVSLLIFSFIYFKDQINRPIIFIVFLLILRIGFNALVIPVRAVTGDDEVYKREAQRIAENYKDLKLYGTSKLNHISAFYITNATQKIVNRSPQLNESKYYIIDSTYMNDFVLIDSFPDASHCGTRWIIKGSK